MTDQSSKQEAGSLTRVQSTEWHELATYAGGSPMGHGDTSPDSKYTSFPRDLTSPFLSAAAMDVPGSSLNLQHIDTPEGTSPYAPPMEFRQSFQDQIFGVADDGRDSPVSPLLSPSCVLLPHRHDPGDDEDRQSTDALVRPFSRFGGGSVVAHSHGVPTGGTGQPEWDPSIVGYAVCDGDCIGCRQAWAYPRLLCIHVCVLTICVTVIARVTLDSNRGNRLLASAREALVLTFSLTVLSFVSLVALLPGMPVKQTSNWDESMPSFNAHARGVQSVLSGGRTFLRIFRATAAKSCQALFVTFIVLAPIILATAIWSLVHWNVAFWRLRHHDWPGNSYLLTGIMGSVSSLHWLVVFTLLFSATCVLSQHTCAEYSSSRAGVIFRYMAAPFNAMVCIRFVRLLLILLFLLSIATICVVRIVSTTAWVRDVLYVCFASVYPLPW